MLRSSKFVFLVLFSTFLTVLFAFVAVRNLPLLTHFKNDFSRRIALIGVKDGDFNSSTEWINEGPFIYKNVNGRKILYGLRGNLVEVKNGVWSLGRNGIVTYFKPTSTVVTFNKDSNLRPGDEFFWNKLISSERLTIENVSTGDLITYIYPAFKGRDTIIRSSNEN